MKMRWWIVLGFIVMALAMLLNELPADAKPLSSAEQSYLTVMDAGTEHLCDEKGRVK